MKLLLISGSLRRGSSNEAVLRTLQSLCGPGNLAEIYGETASLPAFSPDDDFDAVVAPVKTMRAKVAAADAVVICTPEYAGSLPGSFKNLLDWTVGGGQFMNKPVASINAASVDAPVGGAHAQEVLRRVLGYVEARFIEEAWLRMPIARRTIDERGLINDTAVQETLVSVLKSIESFLEPNETSA